MGVGLVRDHHLRSGPRPAWPEPGELTDTEWRIARQRIAESERELRTELSELPSPRVGIDIAQAGAAWPDMTLDEQREFLRLFIRKVTVNRARRGVMKFDDGRVEIDWQAV